MRIATLGALAVRIAAAAQSPEYVENVSAFLKQVGAMLPPDPHWNG